MANQSATAILQENPPTEAARKDAKRAAWLKEGRTAWDDYQNTGLHLDNKEVLGWMDKIIAGENEPMPKCHT